MSFAEHTPTSTIDANDVPVPRRDTISDQHPLEPSTPLQSISACVCQGRACQVYLIMLVGIWVSLLTLFLFSAVIGILSAAGYSWPHMVAHTPGFYWVVIILGVLVTVSGLAVLAVLGGCAYVAWFRRSQANPVASRI